MKDKSIVYIIDGAKKSKAAFDKIDSGRIIDKTVITDRNAIKNYADPRKTDMVILVRTRMFDYEASPDVIYVVNGKIGDKNQMDTISAQDIKSIQVIMNRESIEHYFEGLTVGDEIKSIFEITLKTKK